MKNYGKVSIITPCYNCGKYIAETIESVIAQTYTNWEMLITDDCSTDNSVDIIMQYVSVDPRIKLFKLEKNSGAGVARNNSIKESSGRFISPLDGDDVWFPDKLEKQLALMEECQCAVSYGSSLVGFESGKIKGVVICRHKETYHSTLRQDRMMALTFIYDTEAVGKLYMPTIRKRQDWCYKMLVMKKAKIAYGVKEPLGVYRISPDSLSSRKRSLVKYNIQSYQVTFGWSYLRSVLFFFFLFMPSYFIKKLEYRFVNR